MQIIKTKNFEIAVNLSGDKNSPRLAILMPGRLDTKDYANFTSHAEFLSKLDFLVVAVDPPSTWESPGNIDDYTTTNYVKAVNEVIEYFNSRPTLLLGHSRGGATAMLASSNPAIKWLVVVNSSFGPPSPPKQSELKAGKLLELRDLPPGSSRTEEKVSFELPMIYFEDGAKHDPIKALKSFKGSKLIAHTANDEFVTIEKVKTIYDGLSGPKTFIEIDGTHDYRLFPESIEAVNRALGQLLEKA